ncbi:helix-turn-helix transcriptional regulator [Bradyrhizobium sp. BRP05]|nr:helix-turn-helix transcriptional regulator [Bradyrhizobium sp. BRP05]MCA1418866.1 helix-turn-helix transcriptional regulator [Bradyrhizobium sp. BRP23]
MPSSLPAKHRGAQPSRASEPDSLGVRFGRFCLYEKSRLLEKDQGPVKIGSRALDILCLLVGRAGDIIHKDELLAHAWPNLTVDEASLRVHIAEIRRVLGDGKDGARFITNVPNRGYCFVATIEQRQPAQDAPKPAAMVSGEPSFPLLLTRTIGREDVVQRLSERLLAEQFITLRGPGGIGKTTVALAVAHALSGRAQEVRFVDLGPLKEGDLVPSTVASALNLVVQTADPTSSIVQFLGGRRVVLILDSCEHVIEHAARLAEAIYLQAPGTSILATSRESLLVQGEQIVELPPLATPPADQALTSEEMLAYPAVRLFTERATAAGYSVEMSPDNMRLLAGICEKLDGIALAIELAAVRLGAHGLREIDALLDGRLKLEWRGRRTAPPRHQTLSAMLDWSYNLITDAERLALRRLAVFAGAFTLEAAIAVAGAEPDDEQVIDMIGQLVAKSLLSARPIKSSMRYRLLDTTRTYALKRLSESGEANTIARRHAEYVMSALVRSGSNGNALGLPARSELLGDVRAALSWAYSDEGAAELRVPLSGASAPLLVELNLLNECSRVAQRALGALDDTNRGGIWEIELQSALGHAAMFTERNSEQAEAALLRGLSVARKLSDRPNQFRLLSRLNMFYRRTGECDRLVPSAEAAEEVAREIGDPAGLAGASVLLGVSHHLAGNQILAQHHLEKAMQNDIALRVAGPSHFAFARTPRIPLARTLWLRGFPDQAVELARAVTNDAAPKDVVMYSIALCWAASVFGWVGDWASVEKLTARLSEHALMHGFVPYQAVADGFRGQVMVARGDVKDGVDLLHDVLPRLHADRYELYASGFSADLAQGLGRLGRVEEALEALDNSMSRTSAGGEIFDMPELLRLRGKLKAQGGDEDGARQSLKSSIELAETQGALSWRLRSEITLVVLSGKQGKKSALTALAQTLARFSEGLETADLQSARGLLQS